MEKTGTSVLANRKNLFFAVAGENFLRRDPDK